MVYLVNFLNALLWPRVIYDDDVMLWEHTAVV